MPSKYQKILFKFKSKFGVNKGMPTFWHLGRSNFGDDINPWFYSQLTASKVAWQDTDKPHFMGIGSIAEKLNQRSLILGSGFIEPLIKKSPKKPRKCFSLRGELSCEQLNVYPEFMGDPVCFVDKIYSPKINKTNKIGVIPHVSEYKKIKSNFSDDLTYQLIDPSMDSLTVIDSIASCKKIVSQSLHGLIVADAYSIPSVWLEPSVNMMGGFFKFRDYFSTTDYKKEPISMVEFLEAEKDLRFCVSNYKWDKEKYLDEMKKFILDEFQNAYV